MITEITEIQALGQAGVKGPKTQSIVLPNNVRIEADDVKIAYSQLTIGRALGNGKSNHFNLNMFCRQLLCLYMLDLSLKYKDAV